MSSEGKRWVIDGDVDRGDIQIIGPEFSGQIEVAPASEVERLLEALRKYGDHDSKCGSRRGFVCDCGWEEEPLHRGDQQREVERLRSAIEQHRATRYGDALGPIRRTADPWDDKLYAALHPDDNPALERAVRWLCETTGRTVTLDSLTLEEHRPDIYRARCRFDGGGWEWVDVPAAEVQSPESRKWAAGAAWGRGGYR